MQYAPDSFITELIDATESGVPRASRMAGLHFSFGQSLELKDGAVTWNPQVKDAGDFIVFKPATLTEFIGLARPHVSDERILEYAQTWGMLELCPEGLPRTHDRNLIPSNLGLGMSLRVEQSCRGGGVGDPERLDWWRYWASQAAALAEIIAAVRSDRLGALKAWAVLRAPGPWANGELWERTFRHVKEPLDQMFASSSKSLMSQRHLAGRALDAWARLADLRPEITMEGARASIALRPRSLFGALGLQLVFAAADIDGFALCHGCHVPVIPMRQMNGLGQRVFCEECRKEGRPQREASLARYRRLSADAAFREREAERQRRRRAEKRASGDR
jgi:hypothetical protein